MPEVPVERRQRTQHRAAMAEPDEHELAVAIAGHEITQTDRQLVRDVRDGAPPVIRPGDDLRRQTELVDEEGVAHTDQPIGVDA